MGCNESRESADKEYGSLCPTKNQFTIPHRHPVTAGKKVQVSHFIRQRTRKRSYSSVPDSAAGFTLVEMLISLIVLTFGLLAAGQMIFVAMSAQSLARSKGTASMVAQDRLESLADLYRQNPAAAELTVGAHGPIQVQVTNPTNARILNRYDVAWNVAVVPDARGKVLSARAVHVTVTPINAAGAVNKKASLNKVINVTAIFSPRIS